MNEISLAIPQWAATVLAILAIGLAPALQKLKVYLREIAKEMPDGKLKSLIAASTQKWGPVIATLVVWVAGASAVLWPLVSDGTLTSLELLGVIGGGTLVSNGVHGITRAGRK